MAASSASDEPVGGPDGGARPFWASVSSPRNQSSGGWVQNSLVPDSYFFSGFCCALAWLAPATTTIAASARIDRLNADFIASLPMQPSGYACYLFASSRDVVLVRDGSDAERLSQLSAQRSARSADPSDK